MLLTNWNTIDISNDINDGFVVIIGQSMVFVWVKVISRLLNT